MTGREPALTVARDSMAMLGDLASMIQAAAEWADDELAAGAPPKWVTARLIAFNRIIASAVTGPR